MFLLIREVRFSVLLKAVPGSPALTLSWTPAHAKYVKAVNTTVGIVKMENASLIPTTTARGVFAWYTNKHHIFTKVYLHFKPYIIIHFLCNVFFCCWHCVVVLLNTYCVVYVRRMEVYHAHPCLVQKCPAGALCVLQVSAVLCAQGHVNTWDRCMRTVPHSPHPTTTALPAYAW